MTPRRVGAAFRRPDVIVACLLAFGCGRSDPPPAPQPTGRAALQDVTLPDLARVDQTVREQAREMYEGLQRQRTDTQVADADLGVAYGEYAMLLHAGEYYEAARPAYLNAQRLMPQDGRWPYYLGHLSRSQGDPAVALAAFERALQLMPGDVATLVWVGRGYLEQGQPERAEPFFARALEARPDSVAALAGLGQAALARKDFARAVDVLEKGLAINPSVASLHSPLAMAYRGLGDTAKADAHLKQWRNTDVLVDDPLREQLDIAIQSGLSYELRGVRALEARDFPQAVTLFTEGVRLTPVDRPLGRSLRHKLGTALALTGDVPRAVALFDEVVRAAPRGQRDEPAAKAHYSLGVLAASSGDVTRAVSHLTEALTHNPAYVEARLALGDVLRRRGRFEESMTQYREALAIDPRLVPARLGYALALVRLNRYRDARDWLDEALRAQPDEPDLGHALARILAAAPEASVRDGQRALTLVKRLYDANPSPDMVETMAMVAAEVGDFSQAAAMQREVLEAARQAGATADAARIAANLRLYERGQAVRVPWPADHPVHRPGS